MNDTLQLDPCSPDCEFDLIGQEDEEIHLCDYHSAKKFNNKPSMKTMEDHHITYRQIMAAERRRAFWVSLKTAVQILWVLTRIIFVVSVVIFGIWFFFSAIIFSREAYTLSLQSPIN